MNKRCFQLVAGLIFASLYVQTSAASAVYVGNCPNGNHPVTIQQAVNASASGGTVDICPGTYAEQVSIIGKNLTLAGIANGSSHAAILVSPTGGLAQNATSLGGAGIEAQIYVQDGTVTIKGLTIDAANSNLDSLGCNGDPIGIYYQNASGAITENSVINDVLSPALNGCQGGLGIFVESSGTNSVLISSNNVENYQKNGITVNGKDSPGLTATIKTNTVVGQGPTNGAAENGIQVGFGATGSITNNTVGSNVWAPDVFGDTGDAASGILVYASPNVTIATNDVSDDQYGIAIVSSTDGAADGAHITSNSVSATHLYDGIDLCSNTNTVTGNQITSSDESAIHLDDTCTGASTGNTATGNTINSACAGVLVGPTASGTASPNTYYNTITQVLTGTDTCATPPFAVSKESQAKSSGRFNPARP